MDRREIKKAGADHVPVDVLSILLPDGVLAVLPWKRVMTDSRIHAKANHIYSFLLNTNYGKHLGQLYMDETHAVFSIACGALASGKVYEYMIEGRYGIWCNEKDYKIIKKMEGKRFGSMKIIYGLSSPFDVAIGNLDHTPDTTMDGYEIEWYYN